MSQSLAVKYRPVTFDEIVHQDYVKSILTRQVETHNISHSYIFAGRSGSGKTTTARAFARLINGGEGNPIEIDAASNSGVENVRQLVADCKQRAIDAIYKVIILDECHSLTSQAWQALLLTIEEPPEYTIFIFCTTELNKVPQTIQNRCQVYNFTNIPTSLIRNRLEYICQCEGFTNYADSIDYIAKISQGGMRDAISKLDKCSAYSPSLDIKSTMSILGAYSYDMLFALVNAMIDGDEKKVIEISDYVINLGSDLKAFVTTLIDFVMDIAKYTIFSDFSIIKIPSVYEEQMKQTVGISNATAYFNYMIDRLFELKSSIRYDNQVGTTLQYMLLKVARCQ